MEGKKQRQGPHSPGAEYGSNGNGSNYTQSRPWTHAWRRWSRLVCPEQMTAHQAVAVAMIQAGISETPEQALRMLRG